MLLLRRLRSHDYGLLGGITRRRVAWHLDTKFRDTRRGTSTRRNGPTEC